MHAQRITSSASGTSVVVSSIAAFVGLCCIGPIAVALFGVSGAVLLARLEPARPYLLAVAALLTLVTAVVLYVYPMFNRAHQVTVNNPYQHVFFGVSAALVVFAAFADQIVTILL